MTDPLADSTRLIDALRSPAAYPHPADAVEVIETHISWVLLAGEFAYKLKKPIDLGFADYSTLDRRRRFCEEELRLNRRLAPEVYLEVIPVTGSADAPRLGGSGEPIEFAVRMRRFSQEALLSHVLERGELTAAHVDGLAGTISTFHSAIAVAPPGSSFGSPERVRQPVAENFDHVSAGTADELVRYLANRSTRMFEDLRAVFARRKAEGFVRECHGDMHLGNMLLLDGRVVVFDGIEFNDDLRWIDVLSEVAFVVMDLEDRRRPDLARRLLNAYLERTGDYAGAAVLPFYLAYRAMVRAKVASIRSRQKDLTDHERTNLIAEGRGYLALADRDSRPGRPILVVTHGLSGSGKTTVSQRVLEATGAIRMRADVERKRLFGLGSIDHGDESIYTPEAAERTYARLAEAAEAVVRAGFPAIVDATFLSRAKRETFRRLAATLGVPFAILDARADEAVLRERVARRSHEAADASDADVRVLEGQLRTREPIGEDERRDVMSVEADREETIAAAVAAIEARGSGGELCVCLSIREARR